MPVPLLKLAMRAKDLPEVRIVGRVLLAIVAVFVLVPVVSAVSDPSSMAATDYLGAIVLGAVGVWLLRVAIRGRE